MGRWAQAKRRGAGGPLSGGLPVPPAPELSEVDGFLTQTATGETDTGGRCGLYYSATEEGTRTQINDAAWEAEHSWGPIGELTPGYYWTTETGNNIVYAGESAYSNSYYYEPA